MKSFEYVVCLLVLKYTLFVLTKYEMCCLHYLYELHSISLQRASILTICYSTAQRLLTIHVILSLAKWYMVPCKSIHPSWHFSYFVALQPVI